MQTWSRTGVQLLSTLWRKASMIILPFEVWQQKRDAENIARAITIPYKNEQKRPDNPFSGINLTYLADCTNYCIKNQRPLFPDVERGSLQGLVYAIKEVHKSERRRKVRAYYHTPEGKARVSAANKRYLERHPEIVKKRFQKWAEKWKSGLTPEQIREHNARHAREYYAKHPEKMREYYKKRQRVKNEVKRLNEILVIGFKLYE